MIPMGPIEFPWWFIAAVIVIWLAAVTLPSALPLMVAGVLLARKHHRPAWLYGLGCFLLGSVLAVASYWLMGSVGTIDFDGSFLLCWLPGWLLAAVLVVAARPGEPRAV